MSGSSAFTYSIPSFCYRILQCYTIENTINLYSSNLLTLSQSWILLIFHETILKVYGFPFEAALKSSLLYLGIGFFSTSTASVSLSLSSLSDEVFFDFFEDGFFPLAFGFLFGVDFSSFSASTSFSVDFLSSFSTSVVLSFLAVLASITSTVSATFSSSFSSAPNFFSSRLAAFLAFLADAAAAVNGS